MKIGLIAGTKIDTLMGKEIFSKKGFDVTAIAISETPEAQSKLQILTPEKLQKIVVEKINLLKDFGIKDTVIYCNSLSSAVDFKRIQQSTGIYITTPHDVYREIASKYKVLGVLAANNQSAAGIEKTIQESNPYCHVVGIGILPLVIAIEKGISPNQIVRIFKLQQLFDFFHATGCETLVLGCTHFPYLYDEINTVTSLEIIDPAGGMEKILLNREKYS